MPDPSFNAANYGKPVPHYCANCGAKVTADSSGWRQTCSCDLRIKGIATGMPPLVIEPAAASVPPAPDLS